MILAIDTATEFAGIALYNQDAVWAEEIWHAGRNHTVELTPRLKRMMQAATVAIADLEAIAVSIGPGSYTGVRIAVALAKGLALPYNLSVIGVSTLDIAAYPHQIQPLPVIAVAQAGRKRLLSAAYAHQGGQWQLLAAPELGILVQLAETITEPTLVTGELTAIDAETLTRLTNGLAQVVSPSLRVRRPAVLAEIGRQKLDNAEQDDLDSLVPIYLNAP